MVKRADPFRDLVNLGEMMSRLLEDEVRHRLGHPPSTQSDWIPQVDLIELEDKFILKADLPGMDKKEIKVEVIERQLILKGERRMKKISEEKYHRLECAYGKFSRVFPLSAEIDCNQVSAVYLNGILEVILPKVKTGPSKKISVQCQVE